MPWTEADWDKPGYNPKNGKVRALFRWEQKTFAHPATGQLAPLYSFARPHSRAFHFAWFNFFMCFIMWFAIAPVMPTVVKPKCEASDSQVCMDCAKQFPGDDMEWAGESKKDPTAPKGAKDKKCRVCYPYDGRTGHGCGGVGLTPAQAKNTTLVGIAGTIILRILIGAIADGIGIRTAYSVLLVCSSIPGFILAAANNYEMVAIMRFLVGFAGASFVLTQLWTTTMFDLNCVGIANATSAGWGNLGGGVAQVLNASIFASFKAQGNNNNTAWRGTVAWSPAVIFLLGVAVFFCSDDNPYGQMKDQKKKKTAEEKAQEELVALQAGGEAGSLAARSLIDASLTWQTWVLHLCYMFSFGVELIVNGNLVTYFTQVWAMPQTKAGTIGSIFGLLNLVMRTAGGAWSDQFLIWFGVRGRNTALFIQTVCMGITLITFSKLTPGTTTEGGLLVNLVLWGGFTNIVEGGTYAVVPYVNPSAMGGVAGIVGAGGNMGALLGNFMIVGLKTGKTGGKAARNLAFCALGWGALASACLVPILWLPGIGSMFRAADPAPAPQEKEQKMQPVPQMPGPQPQFLPMGAPPMFR